jgi:RimJ/RimL family protein N-acetyltransferase
VVSEKWDRLGPTLEGQLVRVEPLAEAHEAELREAAGDPDIWRWLPLNAGSSAELFHRWLLDALERKDAGAEAPFVIVDRATGVAIGSTRFLALRPEHRGLEIGWTWLAPSKWRSGVNVETKLLLLGYAFEQLECIRVEFKTDALNERSRAALAGIGAEFEGILRSHMIVRGDVIRDSAYYSVIAREWPNVRAGLQGRLQAHS